MSDAPHVVVPRDALAKIAASFEYSGSLRLRYAPSDDLFVVSFIETAPGTRLQVDVPKAYTALRFGDQTFHGEWLKRPDSQVNAVHLDLLRRPGAALSYDRFRELLGTTLDPGGHALLVITYAPKLSDELRSAGVQEFAVWSLTRGGAEPYPTFVEPETIGLAQLEGLWPLEDLAAMSVTVVGCGSIGSVAADALASYGVGSLHFVDNDRFLWHNILRHRLGPESVGRWKVAALADMIRDRWGTKNVHAHPIDMVRSADYFRGIVRETDLVLCAADGIAPRRVTSHVARRAKVPAVLASVLDHGAIGEIVRLRPTPRFGCLLCFRAKLAADNAIDAEADQELAYGTGTAHQPMTALPADLQVMGVLAAKAAVATLLESRHGDHTQVLPGEHGVIGLRPGGDLSPPFDVQHPGEIRWSTIPKPRAGCPTCNP